MQRSSNIINNNFGNVSNKLFCLPAWVGSVGIACTFALSALTSVLVNRFGCRLTALFGGLLCITGLLLTSLATNIAIMYATYSILFGFGCSCLFVSCYVVTSLYFNNKRSLATGIIASGSGLGVLSVAPLLQALLNSFDWKKTCRIMSGIFSVTCALCLTFDPTVAKREEGKEQANKEAERTDEQDERMAEKPKQVFIDFSVFKEKVFVVLTLSVTVLNLGHNTPRLHMVRYSCPGSPSS